MDRTGETAALSAMSLVDAADEAARTGRPFGIGAIESFAGRVLGRRGRPSHGRGLVEDLTGAFDEVGLALPREDSARATADLFDRINHVLGRPAVPGVPAETQSDALIEIVASPGSQLGGPLMPGDIIVQRALGEGHLASLSVAVDGRLHRRSALAAAGLTPLGTGDGLYVHVIEGGPVAKPQGARRARGIADAHGRLRRDVVVLRTRGAGAGEATPAYDGYAWDDTDAMDSGPPETVEVHGSDWVQISLRNADGSPAAGEQYAVTFSNGRVSTGRLDARGQARVQDVAAGDVRVTFPRLAPGTWQILPFGGP